MKPLAKLFLVFYLAAGTLLIATEAYNAFTNPIGTVKDFLFAGYNSGISTTGPWSTIPKDTLTAYANVQNSPTKCQFATPAWMAAIGTVESNHNPNAVNPSSGATGLMQIMPTTGRQFGTDANQNGYSATDPYDAVLTSARILCEYEKQVSAIPGDRTRNTIAAYYAGPGYVKKTKGNLGNDVAQYAANVITTHTILTEHLANQPPPPPGQWGDHENGQIPPEALQPIPWAPHESLRPDALAALISMNDEWRRISNKNIGITDAYRTFDEQVIIARRNKGTGLAATPGQSNHGWGVAIDINENPGRMTFSSPLYIWLKTNGPRFGYYHPQFAEPDGSAPEPWHFEYGLRLEDRAIAA